MKFTQKDKKQYLSRIKDEVKVFHPLLNSLLPKLPRIENVDYTHGINENGADFVLTRFDDTIGDTEYIGLIVKVGKIHKSISKIEEQIDECDEKRFVLNGKKKVDLNEIWVVSNETVTEGAKTKINRKYSKRKIQFISSTHIIKWVDKFLPNYWYNMPLQIGEYLQKLKFSISETERSLKLISHLNIGYYVAIDLEKIHIGQLNKSDFLKHKIKRLKHEDLHNIISENKIVIVEGGPGYGKSKMLRKLINSYCSPSIYVKYQYIPLIINYKDLVEKYKNDIELMIAENISEDVRSSFNDKNSLIIAIDGLDEKIFESENGIDEFSELVDRITNFDNVKAIFTTRPINDIEKFEKLKNQIAYYEIRPLTTKKIINFIGKICDGSKISHRIIQDIKNSQLFKQLPKSPIAAILLASLLKENQKELPSTLTELYEKYGELMLGRWDVDKGLQSLKEFKATSTIIIKIAKYFVENELDYLAIDEAQDFFVKYLSERNLDIDPDELFNKVTTRSGILQKENILNRVFFKHKTFSEFYYAKYATQAKFKDFIDNRIFDPSWSNTYFFYIGLLADCESELRKIANYPIEDPRDTIMKLVTIGDYFLAGYATPYRVVSEYLPKIIISATKLYFSIIKNEIDTPLKTFSPMVILIFFQKIIRNTFSYEYFHSAIDDTVIEIIADDYLSKEEKIYSLYFVSVILISLNKENPFDKMIEYAKGDIPILVDLVLSYSASDIKHRSKILKKCERKFNKKMKHASPSFREYVDKLFDKPVMKLKF